MEVKEMSELENLKMNYNIQQAYIEELEQTLKEKAEDIAIFKKALEEMYDDLSDVCKALPPYEWYIQQAKESINNV